MSDIGQNSELHTRLRKLRIAQYRFSRSDRGQAILRIAKWTFTLGILAYLVYQFTSIGWTQVLSSLPVSPWFYILFLGMFFTLPASEAAVYGLIWHQHPWRLLGTTLKKRVLNKDVAGYSGELYLYMWANKRLKKTAGALLHDVKDNTIISSIVSTFAAFGLLAGFYLSGHVPEAFTPPSLPTIIVLVIVIAVVVTALIIKFRRSIFRLPRRTLAAISGIHFARIMIVQTLQVAQWMVIIPEAPLEAWFTFLAIQIIANRVPLLPSRDLLSMTAILEICEPLGLPVATVAGMLLVNSVLDKSLNATLFATLSAVSGARNKSSGKTLSDSAIAQEELVAAALELEEADAVLADHNLDN